jgi:hypothetical protein
MIRGTRQLLRMYFADELRTFTDQLVALPKGEEGERGQ